MWSILFILASIRRCLEPNLIERISQRAHVDIGSILLEHVLGCALFDEFSNEHLGLARIHLGYEVRKFAADNAIRLFALKSGQPNFGNDAAVPLFERRAE